MAGPRNQATPIYVVPPGEAQVQYAPSALAYKVQNFEATPEGTIVTIRGPAEYEPLRGQAVSLGEPHGIFHAGLMAGKADTLILRAGTRLWRHTGWNRTWEELESGFSSERRAVYPDQFVILNDTIIWTNGVDYPRIITHDGDIFPLGFEDAPNSPIVQGPAQPTESEKDNYYPNSKGYSWPGRIGTVGDLLSGQSGSLLEGAYYYYTQYEDMFGNLSKLSPSSNALHIASLASSPYEASGAGGTTTAEIDDLLRQSLLHLSGTGPSHAVAIRLYRTPDTRHVSTKPRYLTRIPGISCAIYPDSNSDSDLGPEAVDNWAIRPFRVMCTHQGCLIIGNTIDNPGIVRRSQPGFPGTFPENDWIYPDSGGAEVTAVTSHNGVLLAFTETSVYSLEDFSNPQALSQGIGCVAPRSIKAMHDGSLIWLGRDGFYMMKDGAISERPISDPIYKTIMYGLNKARLRLAVAHIDPLSREYRCAISPAGKNRNNLVLTFDGTYWRRLDYDIHIGDWCVTQDWRQYVLGACYVGGDNNDNYVLAFDRETRTFDPPNRTAVYRSGWLRADDNASTALFVRTLYIGMVDAYKGTATITFYKNGSLNPELTLTTLKTLGVGAQNVAGEVVIGTDKIADTRLHWRQVPVGLRDCFTWAFEISVDYPSMVHLAAFAFDISVAGDGNNRAGRIPRMAD